MRKRTNLDKAEAEYLYAKVLLKFNKQKEFNNLSILEKNNLIDAACIEAVKQTHNNPEDIEAITSELLSYKLTDDELKEFYSEEHYQSNIKPPQNFKEQLERKYKSVIDKIIIKK